MGRSVIAFCATALVAGACIVNVAFGKSPEVTRSDSVHVQGTALCPNMVVAANGDLIVTFTNKGDVLPPTETIFVRSMDGGKTWSDEYLRYAPDGSNKDDGVSVGGMLTMDDGAILAYRLTIVTPDGELGSAPRKTKVEILRSRDNGATFDVVGILKERQDTLVAPYGPMIKLADGQILMGGFIENVGNGYWLSKDNGDTWGEFNNIWKDPPEGAKRNLWFNETAYIVLPGGKILSVARNDTDKIFYTVESEDNGATWINQRATNIGGGSPALHVMANGTVPVICRSARWQCLCGLVYGEHRDGRKPVAVFHRWQCHQQFEG
jgi:hypothetical protein